MRQSQQPPHPNQGYGNNQQNNNNANNNNMDIEEKNNGQATQYPGAGQGF